MKRQPCPGAVSSVGKGVLSQWWFGLAWLRGKIGSECGRGKDSPNLLNELVFWQRRLEELDLVALGLEDVPPRLVHILQEQDLDVFGVEGLELLSLRGPVSESTPHEAALTWRR